MSSDRWTAQDLANYQSRRGLEIDIVDTPVKQNKFHAQKTVVDNITFDSKREATRYQDLKIMEQHGLITGLTLQPEFPLIVEGMKVGIYRADFLYFENGQRVVEDCKSPPIRRHMYYRLKKRLVKALYGFDVRET